jgi:calcineurin-like phosphoesterase family protein
MNKEIINNTNEMVGPNDDLYILGDTLLTRGHYPTRINEIMNSLRCNNIHYLLGNHDRPLRDNRRMCPNKIRSINDYLELSYKNTKVCLFHYPILEWNAWFHRAIHLHSHVHNNLENAERRMDVGVDAMNFAPISIEEVFEII